MFFPWVQNSNKSYWGCKLFKLHFFWYKTVSHGYTYSESPSGPFILLRIFFRSLVVFLYNLNFTKFVKFFEYWDLRWILCQNPNLLVLGSGHGSISICCSSILLQVELNCLHGMGSQLWGEKPHDRKVNWFSSFFSVTACLSPNGYSSNSICRI